MNHKIDGERLLKILHLEDSPRDAEIIRERLLDAGFSIQLDWAVNEQAFKTFLQRGKYDLFLADYQLPGFDAPAALRLTASLCPGVPFICVSGAIGEDKAVELLKQGATDYVSKDRLDRLPLSMKRALDEVRERQARRLAEEEQAKLEGQLQQAQKMEAIGTLAGGIAHDFNNILSVIIGHAEILNLANNIDANVRKGLDQILGASQRAKQLVHQIFAFSRHGKQEKILISLKPIVKESLEFLRASLPSSIEMHSYLEPNAGTIMADPTQMQQILMNLCVNASHAMEKEGGSLQIKLSNTALSEEDARFDPDVEPGDYVKLTVSDTGHGMGPSVRERIFDPYFTTKEPGKGTGLGLSVVHGIVKSHGGMIKVDSEVGKGTTFTIFLPRAMGFEKVNNAPLQPLAMGTEKILFVDDENALADLGQQLLGELGYQVETRTSPIEALEAFRVSPQKFDLVITDLTMPQMSGLNLARKIMEIRPGMPIILCTGFSEQTNEQAANAMGIRAVLYKPLVLRDIAAAVRKVLDSKNT